MLQTCLRLLSLLFPGAGWLEEMELRLALQFWLRAWQKKNVQLIHWLGLIQGDSQHDPVDADAIQSRQAQHAQGDPIQ